ncbi:MAG: T9SS type A sorting domain-containing protein [Chitinophagales bacterium]|nr:T9SS type A sorting domain-containing protein [Bacteroidota bacterium]MCB9043114.1 T9SS type A sorting domain-containing protein [Chitinophagales bacterium]
MTKYSIKWLKVLFVLMAFSVVAAAQSCGAGILTKKGNAIIVPNDIIQSAATRGDGDIDEEDPPQHAINKVGGGPITDIVAGNTGDGLLEDVLATDIGVGNSSDNGATVDTSTEGETTTTETSSEGETETTIQTTDKPIGFASSYTIFPNPAIENVNINFTAADKVEMIRIFDLNGKQLRQQIPTDDAPNMLLSVSEFPQGMYYLQVVGAKEINILPFVVAR